MAIFRENSWWTLKYFDHLNHISTPRNKREQQAKSLAAGFRLGPDSCIEGQSQSRTNGFICIVREAKQPSVFKRSVWSVTSSSRSLEAPQESIRPGFHGNSPGNTEGWPHARAPAPVLSRGVSRQAGSASLQPQGQEKNNFVFHMCQNCRQRAVGKRCNSTFLKSGGWKPCE